MNQLYVSKFAPKTIDDLIINENIKKTFKSYIQQNSIPHMTLYGRAGIGKSSTANILVNELKAKDRTLYINCGYDNNVDVVRTRIKSFCDSKFEDFKVIILDESDSLSKNSGNGSSAQDALRNVIEENQDDSRFILTCNNIQKIIEPIKSRCIPLNISFTQDDIFKRVIEILKSEKIKVCKENLIAFRENVIKKLFPDIRRIINELELWTVSSELIPMNSNYSNDLNKLVEYIITTTDYKTIRKTVMDNEEQFNSDYIALSQALFNKVEKPDHHLIIADYIYKMHIVTDQEIEFYAMIIELKTRS